MNHHDHVNLLRNGIPAQGGTWADFGSGSGAFTLALADLIGAQGYIYSVDKDRGSLREQQRNMQAAFPSARVEYIAADFTQPLALPPLDGIVMANSLHYVRKKEPVLQMMRGYLRPGGSLLLVEYDVDHGNMWVPYPLSYLTWEQVARLQGFVDTALLMRVPSRFLGSMYSALSIREA
ncbi:MAG TPA: class I SAM-dependent methyltransferase [Chthonomonadales bacterium]|nr:class I SAM-dependent methyltransferase [Chthonomonadales bacterium]